MLTTTDLLQGLRVLLSPCKTFTETVKGLYQTTNTVSYQYESGPVFLTQQLFTNRHQWSIDDCLEGKRENYQVCSDQYCA